MNIQCAAKEHYCKCVNLFLAKVDSDGKMIVIERAIYGKVQRDG